MFHDPPFSTPNRELTPPRQEKTKIELVSCDHAWSLTFRPLHSSRAWLAPVDPDGSYALPIPRHLLNNRLHPPSRTVHLRSSPRARRSRSPCRALRRTTLSPRPRNPGIRRPTRLPTRTAPTIPTMTNIPSILPRPRRPSRRPSPRRCLGARTTPMRRLPCPAPCPR